MKPEIIYHPNGWKHCEQWRVNGNHGKLHRLDGPARRSWYENGQKSFEAWYLNGIPHRVGGPAYQNWVENGQKWEEEWWTNGDNLTEEILQWITKHNIELDENRCIVKKNDLMLFKLRWA